MEAEEVTSAVVVAGTHIRAAAGATPAADIVAEVPTMAVAAHIAAVVRTAVAARTTVGDTTVADIIAEAGITAVVAITAAASIWASASAPPMLMAPDTDMDTPHPCPPLAATTISGVTGSPPRATPLLLPHIPAPVIDPHCL